MPNGKRQEGGWTASEWLSKDVCVASLVYLHLHGFGEKGRSDAFNRKSVRWRVSHNMLWLLQKKLLKMLVGSPLRLSTENPR